MMAGYAEDTAYSRNSRQRSEAVMSELKPVLTWMVKDCHGEKFEVKADSSCASGGVVEFYINNYLVCSIQAWLWYREVPALIPQTAGQEGAP